VRSIVVVIIWVLMFSTEAIVIWEFLRVAIAAFWTGPQEKFLFFSGFGLV
jgi:hypothetical protein